jgi:hypothetical protein
VIQKVSFSEFYHFVYFIKQQSYLDILTDIRNLSRFIKQGNSDGAARMARQLVSQGIRLKATSELQNEEEFQYENNSIAFLSWINFFQIIEFSFNSMEMNMVLIKMVEQFLLTFFHQLQFENYVQLYVQNYLFNCKFFVFLVRNCISLFSDKSIFFC